jgi:hypothetical protein
MANFQRSNIGKRKCAMIVKHLQRLDRAGRYYKRNKDELAARLGAILAFEDLKRPPQWCPPQRYA